MSLAPFQPPPSALNRISGTAKGVIGLLFITIALIILNLTQLINLAIYPFSKKTFNRYNHFGSGVWWRLVKNIAGVLHGTKIIVTGDPLPKRENVIIVPNHRQMTDILTIIFLAIQHRCPGDTKWFVKDVIKYVPLLGWSMLFLNNLFVKRNWTRDRQTIKNTFSNIIRDESPIWLIIFAEGTRITPKKLSTSKRILKKKNRRPNNHVMIPHTKGFTSSILGLGDHLDAVYDIAIGYENGTPSLWHFVCGYVKTIRINVKRTSIVDLPSDEHELSNWLFDCYDGKDALLDEFFETGQFPNSVS